MAKYSRDELREAHEDYARVWDECAASGDYNAFADLFTDDCTYIEHVFGEMHGRDAVRQWILQLMKRYPTNDFTYTDDWVVVDEENERVIFCNRTHMPDPGDGREYSSTTWSMMTYAGDGLWSQEEDIYNPAHFATLLTEWQTAKDAASP